jgi:hypothetical protein
MRGKSACECLMNALLPASMPVFSAFSYPGATLHSRNSKRGKGDEHPPADPDRALSAG